MSTFDPKSTSEGLVKLGQGVAVEKAQLTTVENS